MTNRPAYFVVQIIQGREVPSIYWDELPKSHPIENLVYATRLDTLPTSARLLRMTLDQLYKTFCKYRDRGQLPPQVTQ